MIYNAGQPASTITETDSSDDSSGFWDGFSFTDLDSLALQWYTVLTQPKPTPILPTSQGGVIQTAPGSIAFSISPLLAIGLIVVIGLIAFRK